jgi:hypothetical protein
MAVKPYTAAVNNYTSVARYEVSVRIVNIDYVVLYTPASAGSVVEYKSGMGIPVLVGSDTLVFRDLLGNRLEAPIVSRKTVPAQPAP